MLTARSGLGTMLVDLRRTALPASGVVTLHIDGGVRRTIVALPGDRCVHVALHDDTHPFAAQLASQVTGELPLSGVQMFGATLRGYSGAWTARFAQGRAAGPWLMIDFVSAGGSLYVRDYPDAIDPDAEPDWPGYRVYPEARPNVRGTPRRAARRLIATWRTARRESASRAGRDALMPGPCGPGERRAMIAGRGPGFSVSVGARALADRPAARHDPAGRLAMSAGRRPAGGGSP